MKFDEKMMQSSALSHNLWDAQSESISLSHVDFTTYTQPLYLIVETRRWALVAIRCVGLSSRGDSV